MKACLVMITMNEESAIQRQIAAIRSQFDTNIPILIIDSSTDKTADIAKSMGVNVIQQLPPQGYGKAMALGLKEAAKKYDILITMDCDLTYPAEKIAEFIALIQDGWDCVSGNRMQGSNQGMPYLNQFGNWLFAKLVYVLFGYNTTDLTTGMRAYRSEVIRSIQWVPLQFFPAELVLRIFQSNYKIYDCPIEYETRVGEVKMRKGRDLFLLLQAIFYCKYNPVVCNSDHQQDKN